MSALGLVSTLGPAQGEPSFLANFACNLFRTRNWQTGAIDKEGFSNIFTLTRASAGSRRNEYGYQVQAAANEPRFDHDPATVVVATHTGSLIVGNTITVTTTAAHAFQPRQAVRLSAPGISVWGRVTRVRSTLSIRLRIVQIEGSGVPASWYAIRSLGLLVEEQRTNLLAYSTPDENWTYSNTAPVYGVEGYGGGATATRVVASSTGSASRQFYHPSISFVSGQTYAMAFRVRAAGLGFIQVLFPSTSFAGTADANIDIANAAISRLGSGVVSSSVTRERGGWVRGVLTATATASSTIGGAYFRLISSGTSARGESYDASDLTIGVDIDHVQVEAASFALSDVRGTKTFVSRASAATYLDSTGTLRTVAANVARSDAYAFNPDGSVRRIGLLIERGSSNACTRAGSPGAASGGWTSYSPSEFSVSTGVAGPDGGANSSKMTWAEGGSVSSGYYMSQANFNSLGTTGVVSIFLRGEVGGEQVRVAMGTTGGYTALTLTKTWQKYSLPPLALDGPFRLYNNSTSAKTIYASPICVETGAAVASSFIWPIEGAVAVRAADVTTSAAAARQSDQCSAISLTPWFNTSAHTIVTSGTASAQETSYPGLYFIYNDYQVFMVGVSGAIAVNGRGSSGSVQRPITRGGQFRHALAVTDTSFAATANGSAVSIDSNRPRTATPSLFMIGRTNSSGLWNGHIDTIAVYPKRVIDRSLQGLAA